MKKIQRGVCWGVSNLVKKEEEKKREKINEILETRVKGDKKVIENQLYQQYL